MFTLGNGLTTQLGPFKPTKHDYPRFNQKENKGLGRSGRSQKTNFARTYSAITPPSYPMKFPMPASVLKNSDYQSVVSIHDLNKRIYEKGVKLAPAAQISTPKQMVGQAVISSGVQKAGLGYARPVGIQSQEIEISRELATDPQFNLQFPEAGNPVETFYMPGEFPEEPEPPKEYGSGSVVVHLEEVSREALSETGYLYVDSSNAPEIESFHHLQGNHATHEPEFVHQYGVARRSITNQQVPQTDQYRTRHDVPVSTINYIDFGDGTTTQYIDNGGGDLTPFNFSGTLRTTGRREHLAPRTVGDLIVPASGDLYEQALENMEMEQELRERSPSPYLARSLGFSEITKQRLTRPLSPARKGIKRPKSAEQIKPRKQRVLKHEYNRSKLKRKAKEMNVDLFDAAREAHRGPLRRKRRINEKRGTKRKQELEHNLQKRLKLK